MTIPTLTDNMRDVDLHALKAQLVASPPADIAHQLPSQTPGQQAIVFRLLTKTQALGVFELLSRDDQLALIGALSDPEATSLLEDLDGDDRVRLVDEMPARVAKRLVASLNPETRSAVDLMLGYPPESVGRILSPTYIAVRDTSGVGEALQAVKDSTLSAKHVTTVFVVDSQRRYQGLVRLGDLVRTAPTEQIGQVASGADMAVGASDDAGQAARRLQDLNVDALPVVDDEGRLIGALTVDDAMDALDVDTSATMYSMAGIADPGQAVEQMRSERLTSGSILYPVRVRLLFLMVTLAGGLIVGGLIDAFEGALEAVVAVAIFIPLVMDMGGNVGTQSSTIFARGLALGHIDPSRIWRHIAREMRVGLVMGVAIGVLAGTIAMVWQGIPNDIPQLGLAVGISLFVSVNLAAFLGFALPWLLLRLGFDHAPGADPFITTIKDFTGLAVYFGLAVWLLNITL